MRCPQGLDYDLWIGPVPFRPYTPFWVPWNWRGWMPFGTGTIGDWFCHVIDPTFWALDLDAPSTVQAEVTDYDPAKQGLTYPPATKITFEFPARNQRGPVKLVWYDGNNHDSPAQGFRGRRQGARHGGHPLWRQGDDYARFARRRRLPAAAGEASWSNTPARMPRAEKLPRVKNHPGTGLEAIRTGRQAGSNFGYGGPLTQAALLGAIAIRFPGQTLKWDNKKARFTNNEAANAYVHAGVSERLEPLMWKGERLHEP